MCCSGLISQDTCKSAMTMRAFHIWVLDGLVESTVHCDQHSLIRQKPAMKSIYQCVQLSSATHHCGQVYMYLLHALS